MNEKSHPKERTTHAGNHMDRRKFIGGVTAAAAGLTVVPAHALGGQLPVTWSMWPISASARRDCVRCPLC